MIVLPKGFAKKREIHEMPAHVMAKVIEFAAIASVRSMGLHCSMCNADFVASNNDSDPVFTIKCGCREFWSTNPHGVAH